MERKRNRLGWIPGYLTEEDEQCFREDVDSIRDARAAANRRGQYSRYRAVRIQDTFHPYGGTVY